MSDAIPLRDRATYPAIAAYLDECHARIIELTKQRDRAREVAVTLEQQAARALELLGDEYHIWASEARAARAVLRGDDAEN